MYFLRRIMLVMVGVAFIVGAAAAEESVEAPVEDPAVEVPSEAEPPAEAVSTETAAAEPGGSHSVQKGDTLWDLAARYYQDPYKWGRIWEANRDEIRNPNLIYPDQNFRIPGADAAEQAPAAEAPAEEPAAEAPAEAPSEAAVPVEAAAEPAVTEAPAEETAVEEAQAPAEAPVEAAAEAAAPAAEEESQVPSQPPKKKPSRYVATDLGSDNFVVDENWEADGYILRDEFKKLMIAQDDVVYLNVGAANGAKPYMRGGVYRRGGKVKDPDTQERLGYIMRRIGTFQLTENVGEQSSSAVITSSKEPLRIGDIIRLENN